MVARFNLETRAKANMRCLSSILFNSTHTREARITLRRTILKASFLCGARELLVDQTFRVSSYSQCIRTTATVEFLDMRALEYILFLIQTSYIYAKLSQWNDDEWWKKREEWRKRWTNFRVKARWKQVWYFIMKRNGLIYIVISTNLF